MKPTDKKSLKTEKLLRDYFHYAVIIGICAINLTISALIRRSNIFFVANPTPISFNFGYYSSIIILVSATWLLIKFDLFKKSPVYGIFVMSGLYSNFAEKLIWNNVADYLSFANVNLNLADIQIFLGVIMINVEVWLRNRPAIDPDHKKK